MDADEQSSVLPLREDAVENVSFDSKRQAVGSAETHFKKRPRDRCKVEVPVTVKYLLLFYDSGLNIRIPAFSTSHDVHAGEFA